MSGATFHFTTAEPTDINELDRLERQLFHTDRCSRRSFRYLIRRGAVLLARRQGEKTIAGYAILLSRRNSRKMRVYSLAVLPAERQAGLGSMLVAEIEAIARRAGSTSLTLEVADSNLAALALYRKCGFHQHGFRYGYYQDGGHALLLHKNLTTETGHDHPLYTGRPHQ